MIIAFLFKKLPSHERKRYRRGAAVQCLNVNVTVEGSISIRGNELYNFFDKKRGVEFHHSMRNVLKIGRKSAYPANVQLVKLYL